MSKRTVIVGAILVVVTAVVYAGGNHLWHALLHMHGR